MSSKHSMRWSVFQTASKASLWRFDTQNSEKKNLPFTCRLKFSSGTWDSPIVHATFVITNLAVQLEIFVELDAFPLLLTHLERVVARGQRVHRIWVFLCEKKKIVTWLHSTARKLVLPFVRFTLFLLDRSFKVTYLAGFYGSNFCWRVLTAFRCNYYNKSHYRGWRRMKSLEVVTLDANNTRTCVWSGRSSNTRGWFFVFCANFLGQIVRYRNLKQPVHFEVKSNKEVQSKFESDENRVGRQKKTRKTYVFSRTANCLFHCSWSYL